MRILLLSDGIPPEKTGGAEKIAWYLAQGLHQAGHEVHVVAATTGPYFEEIRDGIPTYHVHAAYPQRWQGWLSLYNPQTYRTLRTLYERIKPDVVNGHNVHRYLTYASFSLAHRLGIPAVFTAHDALPVVYNKLTHFVNPDRCGVDSPSQYRIPRLHNATEMHFQYNPLRNPLIRLILSRHVAVRTAVSEALRQGLEANGLPAFRVVHSGLPSGSYPSDFTPLSPVVESLGKRLELADRQVIVFGGRISREKGSIQMLQALDQVVKRNPAALLLALTSYLDQSTFFAPPFTHLRDKYVRWGGWLSGDELIAAYRSAQVVAVPSIYLDPAPTVNLEAMATERALVSTCYGGSPEFVVDGQTGYIVNPFDTEAFAQRLESLLSNEPLRRQLGEAGRRRFEEQFTLDKQVAGMVKAYEDAITQSNATL